MRLVKASFKITTPINRDEILKRIEFAGRTCYKSEEKITEDSASRFVKMIVKSGHLSVIEHVSITVKFICESVLPNSLKTEIVTTANLREWYHIFKMRTQMVVHLQVREVMQPLLMVFKKELPEIYGDLGEIGE